MAIYTAVKFTAGVYWAWHIAAHKPRHACISHPCMDGAISVYHYDSRYVMCLWFAWIVKRIPKLSVTMSFTNCDRFRSIFQASPGHVLVSAMWQNIFRHASCILLEIERLGCPINGPIVAAEPMPWDACCKIWARNQWNECPYFDRIMTAESSATSGLSSQKNSTTFILLEGGPRFAPAGGCGGALAAEATARRRMAAIRTCGWNKGERWGYILIYPLRVVSNNATSSAVWHDLESCDPSKRGFFNVQLS